MIVSSSDISMKGQQTYSVHTSQIDYSDMTTANGTITNWQSLHQYESDYVETSQTSLLASGESATYSWQSLNEQGSSIQIASASSTNQSSSLMSIRSSMLMRLLEIFLGNRRDLLDKIRKEMGLSEQTSTSGMSTWQSTSTHYSTIMETQATSFQTMGTAVTSDGRALSFHVEVEMSESFIQQSGYSTSETGTMLTDPLVVWLNDSPEVIEDQKFSFDLDSDGKTEEMSSLASGKGFLAYDKNEDGIINDGSELFGTKSGDGFRDLAEYDEDKNGFIDEADSIYKKLRVWTKDSSGNEKLLDLKEADIGAIYLGHLATTLNIKDDNTQATKAVIRSSGVFLHENGKAGVIQQIDFATQKEHLA